MADTFTANYNLTKPQIGGDTNTWGTILNANFDTIDAQMKANATAAAAVSAAIVAVPGMIIMWAGTLAAIPAKWHICDGTAGTPDLRSRMVIGAGGSYAVGAIGGSASAGLTIANMPPHNHGVTDPGHAHGVYDPGHAHSIFDPGHNHAYTAPGAFATPQNGSGGGVWFINAQSVNGGISTTGIQINPSGTGIGIYGSGTGVQTQVAGGGASFSVQNPYMALAYLMYTG
ncbi:phage tail protein [Paraburkholderia sp. RL18-103-BIB-C]|uniref:phage tail protein n=1 Tax=Paraburkholderia sp. RL18-103-BIB-C TaxID=3031637 RepID=UPI0038B7A036